MRVLAALALLMLAACGGSGVDPEATSTTVAAKVAEGTLTEIHGFGTNPGDLDMFEYVPGELPAKRPIVVALHGCTQAAEDFDDETGWTRWADEMQFVLVLPQQRTRNNAFTCFQWWQRGDRARGQGEVLSIKQMVDWVLEHHASDDQRVFVTGLSAGAAMTNALLAAYPDVFAAGAPVAGVPQGCASTVPQTQDCNAGSVDKTSTEWAELVRDASDWKGPWPRVSIWHGTADATVSSASLRETLEQWTGVHGIDDVAEATDAVGEATHSIYRGADGVARVETYSVAGMGHGQPVDPGSGADQCGEVRATMLDVGVCASRRIALWFGVDA